MAKNVCKISRDAAKAIQSIATIDTIPGDKSISHRLVMLGSLCDSQIRVTNFLFSEDCLNTIRIFQQMGVEIYTDFEKKEVVMNGVGLHGLRKPDDVLDVGNSGTSIRLLSGILCAQHFDSTITGDASIQNRPMGRVVGPLREMGANINNMCAPLEIQKDAQLRGISYPLRVASAQVKSAILLAGLYANGDTTVIEPQACRDHTERLMRFFGVDIKTENGTITLTPPTELHPQANHFQVPSDISSAAFFLVLGTLLKARWTLTHVGMNPTRYQVIDVLKSMVLKSMHVKIESTNLIEGIEPYADLAIQGRVAPKIGDSLDLDISPDLIPFIIDEIPILAVAALFASGTTIIPDIKELRVKESDRVEGIRRLVEAIGGQVEVENEELHIIPAEEFRDFKLDCHNDHRIAMSAIVAAIAAGVEAKITGVASIATSFPNFFEILESLDVNFTLE